MSGRISPYLPYWSLSSSDPFSNHSFLLSCVEVCRYVPDSLRSRAQLPGGPYPHTLCRHHLAFLCREDSFMTPCNLLVYLQYCGPVPFVFSLLNCSAEAFNFVRYYSIANKALKMQLNKTLITCRTAGHVYTPDEAPAKWSPGVKSLPNYSCFGYSLLFSLLLYFNYQRISLFIHLLVGYERPSACRQYRKSKQVLDYLKNNACQEILNTSSVMLLSKMYNQEPAKQHG